MFDGCRGKQIVEDLRGCRVCGLDRVRVDLRCGCGVDVAEPVRDGGLLRDVMPADGGFFILILFNSLVLAFPAHSCYS